MNICFFSEYFNQGGIGRVTSIIMNSLSLNCNYSVFSLTYAKTSDDSIYSISDGIDCSYLLEERVSMKNAIIKKGIIRRLKVYVEENNIDVLIACGDLLFPISIFVKSKKCKVICWDHTSPFVNTDQQFQKISRILGIYLSTSNVLLTKKAQEVFNNYPFINKQKNHQIYNPIDPKLQINGEYNSASKKILSVGRLCYQKNFERLLDIASSVFCNGKYAEWTWDIYGIGPDEEKLLKKRKELGLEGKVCFKGQVPDLYNRYKDYSFMVMTSRYEGFPMTLLEASANSIPMISFDIMTGPNEIIINGKNGILCSDESNHEIINAIQSLMESPNVRCEMANQCLNKLEQFSINTITRQWEELFLEIQEDNISET